MCSFCVCFAKPRYRVFRYRNWPFTTAKAVFKFFCKAGNRDAQMISGARGHNQRPTANAATASAAWPWQVAGEMLKWMTDGKAVKLVIPIAVGENSIAFPRCSVKAGVD